MRQSLLYLTFLFFISCNQKVTQKIYNENEFEFHKNDFIDVTKTRIFFQSVGNIIENKDTILLIAKNNYGTSIFFERKEENEKIYFETNKKDTIIFKDINIELFLVDESCYSHRILPNSIILKRGSLIKINDLVHNGTFHKVIEKKYRLDSENIE
ncbi:MAG: hypothetical protein RIQ59_481 [Bacteroidota bacterium]|jgi:hypothetical protein